ncbi:hypothetical protein BQ8794_180070 [Mesorhizobium prunaredense]|uniref:Uncharacterized protein n=1 Tax=Mesorhizobium prunaredense TaxID=1631249 RepID=A0A1R3V7F5_9HYPH|nr:hypothetical protein BQ8794_180070 [Mesorhizobium prunaredense]
MVGARNRCCSPEGLVGSVACRHMLPQRQPVSYAQAFLPERVHGSWFTSFLRLPFAIQTDEIGTERRILAQLWTAITAQISLTTA